MPPPLASFHRRRGTVRGSGWWKIYFFHRSKALSQRKGLSSVSLTANCSLCRGSLLASFPAKPPLKGEVPAIGGRRGSFPQRQQVTMLIGDAPPLRRNHLCRSPQVKRQPLFGREGSGGRGASLREAASPPRISPPPSLHDLRPCGGVVAGLGEAPAVRNGERRFGVAESNA